MAVSRVGGSKGKLTGQVGTVIYQVRKDEQGRFVQIVYSKGERTEEVITPKLQAQRMCVAMVESLMRDLKEIGRISFQSGTTRSNSLNAFSSNNIRRVQRDCKDNWYEKNTFVYPARFSTVKDIQDLGGPYIISSGTLKYNIFDNVIYDDRPAVLYQDIDRLGVNLYGLSFSCRFGVETLGDFLMRHRMTRSDSCAFCGFRSWLDYSKDPENPVNYMKHEFVILRQNMRIPTTEIMTPTLLNELFEIKSSSPANFFIAKDNLSFAIGFLTEYDDLDDQFYYMAGFSISYPEGRKQISTSFYSTPDGSADPWWINRAPADVFGSWMDEPQIKPYPSPF